MVRVHWVHKNSICIWYSYVFHDRTLRTNLHRNSFWSDIFGKWPYIQYAQYFWTVFSSLIYYIPSKTLTRTHHAEGQVPIPIPCPTHAKYILSSLVLWIKKFLLMRPLDCVKVQINWYMISVTCSILNYITMTTSQCNLNTLSNRHFHQHQHAHSK